MSDVRLIDANALKEDFKHRLEKAKNWKENALNNSDNELAIRADAHIDFICEVIMTIDNAPTVELTEEQAIDKLYDTGWIIRHDKEMTERPQGKREFIEILTNYPPDDLCTYPEYRGKPYYSIHYRENGEEFVGYGTYKIEVLSGYLRDYFFDTDMRGIPNGET